MIEEWYPDAKKLEMFSRPTTEGLFSSNKWDTFGNEMADSIELDRHCSGLMEKDFGL